MAWLLLPQARVEIEALHEGVDLSETITRARFEELNLDLFKKTLGPVRKASDRRVEGASNQQPVDHERAR